MHFSSALVITALLACVSAAPTNEARDDSSPKIVMRDGSCTFADGVTTAIPAGKFGCAPTGGIGSRNQFIQCNADGTLGTAQTCPLKTVFLFVKEAKTCNPDPAGADNGADLCK